MYSMNDHAVLFLLKLTLLLVSILLSGCSRAQDVQGKLKADLALVE
jgi:hypothetical protein